MIRVIIIFDGDEYRVPGPKGTEAQAYYTDDREDAIGTAKLVYGTETVVKIRKSRGA